MDWDGKVSTVVFFPGCTFRCPWCYAKDLVIDHQNLPDISLKKYLLSKKEWIDGVVLIGGEPTLQKDLPEFCSRIKELGFLVKLDTNGTNPVMLKQLIDNKLIDYVAMDIKAPLNMEDYSTVNGGFGCLIDKVKESVNILMTSGIDYEFRTTMVPGIHIQGARKYAIQNFTILEEGKLINPEFETTEPYVPEKLEEFKGIAKKYINNVIIR